ncbi:glycoside hydrolase family 3 protein [Pseudoalteromonas sp. R3]|uniref:glycoside hydrolase family 3 protein n=1 Tax=Pseudoalteromonas sp. R3 TaxID=1709477 RepID=UPI0006B447A4|nr:glycoside hydrolase family 3 protein [Pseudoalteromonas sp. R3]AZZ96956.1 glycoside hydrolase family 3 protein [Pseudoalteromonas sp. R3]
MDIEKKVAQLIDTLSIEEKVGQLFVLAFAGEDRDYAKTLVKERHVGGFYITDDNAANPTSAAQLAQDLQHEASLRACDAPLLLAVDQEGAWGILTRYTDLGPGNLGLGKADNTALTADMYQVFAEQMQEVGYNTLLSPCADVNADPDNPIIGLRAFGEQSHHVARHVAAAVRGVERSGSLSCAKHFPGHGDTHSDSHQTLPVVDKSLQQLMREDLLPFKAAIESGVPLIMTSHISYPQIDADHPATLSSTILQGVLRQQLGFEGLIITDSMNMWSMRKNYAPEEAAIQALQAGANLVMLSEEHYENSTTPYKAIQAQTMDGVIAAVKQGSLPESVIDARLQQVLTFKYQHFAASSKPAASVLEGANQLAREAAEAAIRVVRNRHQQWPLAGRPFTLAFAADPKGYDSIVNSRGIGPNDPNSARDVILETLAERGREYRLWQYDQLLAALQAPTEPMVEPLVIITEDYPLPGESFDVAAQQQRVKQALQKWSENVIVIAMRSDYEVAQYTDLSTYVCAYSSRAVSARAMAELL